MVAITIPKNNNFKDYKTIINISKSYYLLNLVFSAVFGEDTIEEFSFWQKLGINRKQTN